MNFIFLSFLVLSILHVERCTSQSRYCQDAVDSVKIVDSCPMSKADWDDAARRKDCGRIASKQNCTTVEKFQYHCAVNGRRNKLIEVCAPTRIIFGHCVEFNELGGVIQDQLSSPCNATFPKCAEYYISSEVYKYSDCYKLVSKNDGSLTFEGNTTTPKDILIITKESDRVKFTHMFLTFVFILALPIACFLVPFSRYIREQHWHSKQHNRKHNEVVLRSIEKDEEGGVKYTYIKQKSTIEMEDEETTCLIPRKVEDEQNMQHSSSNQSLSRCLSKSESAVNNLQYSGLNQPESVRQPFDQDIRQRTSNQCMSQRFARSDSAAYNKGFKVSYLI